MTTSGIDGAAALPLNSDEPRGDLALVVNHAYIGEPKLPEVIVPSVTRPGDSFYSTLPGKQGVFASREHYLVQTGQAVEAKEVKPIPGEGLTPGGARYEHLRRIALSRDY